MCYFLFHLFFWSASFPSSLPFLLQNFPQIHVPNITLLSYVLIELHSLTSSIMIVCFSEVYPDHAPSILSDAWLSIQGPRNLQLGSTWEWNSRNYSSNVPSEEASKALQELLPKASAIYPAIKNWAFTRASAGLRAMPPLTPHGSLPLLGCLNDLVGGNHTCKYWLFGGLGSRGLLYHGWLGKLLAQAVLSCNEDLLPSELTSWRNKKDKE